VLRVRAYSRFAAGVADGQPGAAHRALTGSLAGAKPRSCLAVRFGRGYRGGEGRSPPLVCGICGSLPDAVSCEPLLVSGEVIGSILVNHPDPPADEAHQRIRESVTQAAPVLANLRNLALAELRAATDALIRAADRPLYAAKANGRNRPELFISPARSARTPA
jgi:hypothetical protein